jgi:hypothetical protein
MSVATAKRRLNRDQRILTEQLAQARRNEEPADWIWVHAARMGVLGGIRVVARNSLEEPILG